MIIQLKIIIKVYWQDKRLISEDINRIGSKDKLENNQKKFSENNSDAIKSKKMDLDAGYLGKVFGNSSSAPSNIAGIVILFLLIGTPFIDDLSWEKSFPILTLSLGYLFGKST